MNPTPQQQAFLDTLIDTNDHITLLARAGCGKTTAILMGFEAYANVYPNNTIHVCAFNKAIADEVSEKLKARGFNDWKRHGASTIHSMGMGLLRPIFKPTVDDSKVRNIINWLIDEHHPMSGVLDQFRGQITSLIKYAKQAGVGFFDDMQIDNPSTWYELADHFDVNGFDNATDMDKVIQASQVVYKESLNITHHVDYDDMVLMPLVFNLKVKYPKDLIFVDEAQDLSRSRQALALKFLKPITGRMVVVGDDKQAIYGFSGADSQPIDNLTNRLSARVLPLSVTWRCPQQVVKLAQSLVPDLQASDKAIDGEVTFQQHLPEDLTPGKEKDAILCRNTAPLIDIAYKLIRSGKPCKVEGRKIGEGLINLVERWKVNTTATLINRLEDYRDREIQKAVAKGKEHKVTEIEDKVTTILEIIKAVNSEGKKQVSDVVEFIKNLFADGAENVITCATYHRSKGREWDRVVLFEHGERCPSKMAKQQWQKDQEANLAYVAFTRAKKQLVFVR